MSGINSILGVFTNGLSSSFGDIIARDQQSILQKSYKQFETFYYALITIAYSICHIMIMPFIKLFTEGITDVNYNIPILGILFTLNGFLYNLKTPQGMMVMSAGMYKETKWRSLTQALIIVVFGVILSYKFKLVGVLVASCLANLYRDVDLLFYTPKKIIHIDVRQTLVKFLWIILAMLLIIVPFTCIKINVTCYFEWFFYAFVVGIYSCFIVLCIVIIFQKEDVDGLFKRLLNLINKKG